MQGCIIGTAIGGMAESARRTGSTDVPAQYVGLRGKSYAVVVAVDRLTQAQHPGLVARLTSGVNDRLALPENGVGASAFIPSVDLLNVLYETPQWPAMPPGDVAKMLGVERLIMIELYEYQLHEPGNRYVWDGVAAGAVTVYEADSGIPDDPIFEQAIRVSFPDGTGYMESDIAQSGVTSELATAGAGIALLGATLIVGCNIVTPIAYAVHGPGRVKAVHKLDAGATTAIFIDDPSSQVSQRRVRAQIGQSAQELMLAKKVVVDMIDTRATLNASAGERHGKMLSTQEIGEAVGADVIIWGLLSKFTLSADGVSNLPTASIQIKVMDVATGETWPADDEFFPLTVGMGQRTGFAPSSGAEQLKGEAELAARLGQAMAQLFYNHDAPRASGGGRESSLFAWNLMRGLGRVEPGAVLLVGDAMSRRWMRAHGIAFDACVAPTGGRVALAWPSVLRAIRRRRPGAIRCWSAPTLRLASGLARFHRAAILGTLVEGPCERERVILGAKHRIESLDVFDDQDAQAWRRHGLSAETVDLPEPSPAPGDTERRRLQRGLGVAETDLLLGTLLDHPSETDVRRLSFLLAILAVSERSVVGLAPEGGRLVEAGRRYARVINRDYRLLFTDRPLIDQLRVLDACVIPDPTRGQARGARRVLEHAAAGAGVRAYERPEYAQPGGPTPPEMIRPMLDVLEGAASIAIANKYGIELPSIARKFDPREDVERFDLILAMDRQNERDLLGAGAPEGKVRLMRSYDPALESASGEALDVPDPYYGRGDGFQRVYDMLTRACEGLLDELG
eukprot:g5894.t1